MFLCILFTESEIQDSPKLPLSLLLVSEIFDIENIIKTKLSVLCIDLYFIQIKIYNIKSCQKMYNNLSVTVLSITAEV